MQLSRDYEDKRFYKYLNYAKIMFLVAMILAIICGVGSIIDVIITAVYLILNYEELNIAILVISLINSLYWIVYLSFQPISLYRKMRQTTRGISDDFSTILWTILTPLIIRILFWLLSISMTLANMYINFITIMGYTLMPYIFVYIADIFLILCLVIIKKDYNKNPPAFMQAKIKVKQEQQRQKQKQSDYDNYNKYINEAGKKFFLKNYYLIKELSFADAMDTIEDKYSYEDKAKRVNAVKKIFELKLEEYALKKIISESTGEINIDIKTDAENIYNKEFATVPDEKIELQN